MATKNYTFSVTGDKFQLSIVTLQLLSLYPTIQRLYEIIDAQKVKHGHQGGNGKPNKELDTA